MCPYCRGKGWLVDPVWVLAWVHPEYPNLDAVQDSLSEQLGPVNLHELPVHEPCSACNGSGRRYKRVRQGAASSEAEEESR